MCGASKLAANEHKCLKKPDVSAFQLIVEFTQFAPTSFQAFKLIVVLALIADFQLIVEYYLIKYAEEAIINNQKFQFIVAFIYSKISLNLCENCGIFCEGVKEAIIRAIHRNNIP
jgi:hypothetical protein